MFSVDHVLFPFKKYSELNDLVKTLQSQGVICRVNAPWSVTNQTLIICKTENTDNKVLSQAVKIEDLEKVTEKELLDIAGVSEAEYHEALENPEKKATVLYKPRLCEMNIVLYNTVILQLLKSKMNIQFVTGIYTKPTS